ncbi:MAG: acyl-CoA/acyl-ACP dehydrogenase [Actinomycetota bacterium]|jgi:alkylation response protein AidB-like acyl-CoA dehydrogenase|nr:acyl-CoA/acyl-ACP dehydrogenase [Actinomycetota bacterium]
MDFAFTEEQEAVIQASAAVFGGAVDPERVASVERSEERVDRDLWSALAGADLLGLAVPRSFGGAGQGLTELCLVLAAQGACVAPVPLWATLVLGALPVARFAPAEVAGRWLPGVASGNVMLSAALSGTVESIAGRPPVQAEPAGGGGWHLTGLEPAVPQAHLADRLVVPAATPSGGVVIALVDPAGDGVVLERAETTNREIHPHVHLSGAPVAPGDMVVGDPESGGDALGWMLDAAWTGLSAIALGVCTSAVRQTAAYLNEREQFGRPLSTFQGAMLRAADAAIDVEAMRVTLWHAAWRIDAGLPSAEAVAVAKWQASERGQRVVHAAQHLHGGVGADVTYPIHRYFLWGKQIELVLGGPSRHLARLGALIASRTAAEGDPSAQLVPVAGLEEGNQ